MFSAPPEDAWRTESPPSSSATSGARFLASSEIFAGSARHADGQSAMFSRAPAAKCPRAAPAQEKSSKTSEENFYRRRYAPALFPAPDPTGGSTTRAVGEAARTMAASPPMVTVLVSASPQKPEPRMSNRSLSEAMRGTDFNFHGSHRGIGRSKNRCRHPALTARNGAKNYSWIQGRDK